MLGMMGGKRVKLTSDAASPIDSVLQPSGMRIEGVDGIAARDVRELAVMVWNYREEDRNAPAIQIKLEVVGLPKACGKIKVEEFRVDVEDSNAYSAWQKMGSPQKPTAAQYTKLEEAGRLKQVAAPMPASAEKGKCNYIEELPPQSVSLVRWRW
jgi:xylan 1,4-beta-xylosidase